MKKKWLALMLLVVLLSACSSPNPQQLPSEKSNPENSASPSSSEGEQYTLTQTVDSESISSLVVSRLAQNLGIPENRISVIQNNEVVFVDSCMEVPLPGVKCAQVPVPGKIILLEADHIQYEYHVRDDGLVIQPASLALSLTQDGGSAGSCDRMLVFLSGEVYGLRCNAEPDRMEGTLSSLLSIRDREQFYSWTTKFGPVNLDKVDSEGGSDPIDTVLMLDGNGTDLPSEAEEQELLIWAQTLFQKLYS